MGIRGLALAGLTMLAGCDMAMPDPATMTMDALNAEVSRSTEAVFSETPFANGTMSVVVVENGELRTYRLVPCVNGTAICSGNVNGQAGRLTLTPDHYVVQGVYGDRTFFLRPGGGGTMRRGGVDVPLVWNAYVNGVSRLDIDGIYPY